MAKMFYSLDETKAALGKNEEEIKQMSREGRLREFRDGTKLMFKADQVEQLKAELGGGGGAPAAEAEQPVDLGVSDTGLPLSLADSQGGSTGGISLAAESEAGTITPASAQTKEDTALAADLGLSGSLGGVPSPGRLGGSALSGTGVGSAQGSRSGINVFGTDEVPAVDPGAQTAITSGVRDQVNLESVGSGSGLLDLTRESDDTSLGAELLDEISPGAGGKKAATGDTTAAPALEEAAAIGAEAKSSAPRAIGAPTYVEAPDALAPAFGGLALGAAMMVGFGAFVLISALCDTRPELLTKFREQSQPLVFALLIGLIVSVVCAAAGFVIGKLAKR